MKFDSIGMNADLSDPVKFHALSFSDISGNYKIWKIFFRSLETGDAPSFVTGLDDGQRKESKVRFTSYGITLHISSEIVSIVFFREHCVKSSFRK